MTPPLWIRTAEDLAGLAVELGGAPAVAIDTEADSLHHYPGKLCLVQICDDRGRGHLVDPLVLRDLSPLGAVLADPNTIKVLHAADNDLAYLKRLYGVTVASLFDTAVAARFLGATALGLEGLLTQYLGVTAVKSRQKDDWSRRPLSSAQEAYALDDVLHLIPLRARLLDELRVIGREEWVAEECAALAALNMPEKATDPDAYMKLKGAKDLDGRGLAVLRELANMRETLAVKADRPPFMIMGNEVLVALAVLKPRDAAAILTVKGCTAHVVRRAGEAILAAVERGMAVPDAELPVRRPNPRPRISGAVQRRSDALRAWRVEAAKRVELDAGVIFPQRLIDRLAQDPPRDINALAQVEGVGRWRAELFGVELMGRLS